MTQEEHSGFVDVSVSVYDRAFDFHLCRRPVPLGQYLTVDYHWMDVSEIRQGTEAQHRDFASLNSCISLWWHVVRLSGQQHEPKVIQIYLLALCYLLLARVKGQFRLYCDAIPRSRRYYDAPSLDDCRLSDVTSTNVGTHLHTILDGDPGSDDEQQYARMLIGWLLSWGTAKFMSEGNEGLNEFLGKIQSWNASRRRRSHGLLTTGLLDELAFSSKMAFYQCYANAWVVLIPKLAEHGLAPASQSFLYCWHCPDFEEQDDNNIPTPPGSRMTNGKTSCLKTDYLENGGGRPKFWSSPPHFANSAC